MRRSNRRKASTNQRSKKAGTNAKRSKANTKRVIIEKSNLSRKATDHKFTANLVYPNGKNRYVRTPVDPHLPAPEMLSLEGNDKELNKLLLRAARVRYRMRPKAWVLPNPPTGFHSHAIPGNFCRGENMEDEGVQEQIRTRIAAPASIAMAESFNDIQLEKLNKADVIMDPDEDYGNHVASLSGGSHLVMGWCDNEHNDLAQKNKAKGTVARSSGLLELEKKNGSLQHFKNLVRSIAATVLPVAWIRLRINCMRGNRTKAHTDSSRGCSPNGVMFHAEGGKLCFTRRVEFKISVVQLNDSYFIPFDLSAATNKLWMIGFDDREGKEGKAIWYLFDAAAFNEVRPIGRLKNIVLGIKEGRVNTVPFASEHNTPESFKKNASFIKMDLEYLVKQAKRKNFRCSDTTYLEDEKLKIYELGAEPHVWYWFWGWRYVHWFEGDENVPRTHLFMRLCNESVVGANKPTKRSNRHWIDMRKS